jgi:hypothetical protein
MLGNESAAWRGQLEGNGAKKGFLPWGVTITRSKGSFPPRESKEIQAFFFDFLGPDLAGLGRILQNLGLIWMRR